MCCPTAPSTSFSFFSLVFAVHAMPLARSPRSSIGVSTDSAGAGFSSNYLTNTNKMHFSFLIFSSNLSSTCFE